MRLGRRCFRLALNRPASAGIDFKRSPEVSRFMRINSFHAAMKVMMAMVTDTGRHMGKTMRTKICK